MSPNNSWMRGKFDWEDIKQYTKVKFWTQSRSLQCMWYGYRMPERKWTHNQLEVIAVRKMTHFEQGQPLKEKESSQSWQWLLTPICILTTHSRTLAHVLSQLNWKTILRILPSRYCSACFICKERNTERLIGLAEVTLLVKRTKQGTEPKFPASYV